MRHDRIPEGATEARFAVVDHEKSWLMTPLNWRVRIYGQGVGGYAPADGSVSRYADKARATAVAQVWMEQGIYPAQQGHQRLSSQNKGD